MKTAEGGGRPRAERAARIEPNRAADVTSLTCGELGMDRRIGRNFLPRPVEIGLPVAVLPLVLGAILWWASALSALGSILR